MQSTGRQAGPIAQARQRPLSKGARAGSVFRIAWTGYIFFAVLTISRGTAASCGALCVSRTDDNAGHPVPGMLRYAVNSAPSGATVTFDAALLGRAIQLDATSPSHHIRIDRDLTIQ